MVIDVCYLSSFEPILHSLSQFENWCQIHCCHNLIAATITVSFKLLPLLPVYTKNWSQKYWDEQMNDSTASTNMSRVSVSTNTNRYLQLSADSRYWYRCNPMVDTFSYNILGMSVWIRPLCYHFLLSCLQIKRLSLRLYMKVWHLRCSRAKMLIRCNTTM